MFWPRSGRLWSFCTPPCRAYKYEGVSKQKYLKFSSFSKEESQIPSLGFDTPSKIKPYMLMRFLVLTGFGLHAFRHLDAQQSHTQANDLGYIL